MRRGKEGSPSEQKKRKPQFRGTQKSLSLVQQGLKKGETMNGWGWGGTSGATLKWKRKIRRKRLCRSMWWMFPLTGQGRRRIAYRSEKGRVFLLKKNTVGGGRINPSRSHFGMKRRILTGEGEKRTKKARRQFGI